jgi:hypothetical protein
MTHTIFDKAREIKAMQYAMAGKVMKGPKGSFSPGGKWEVVHEFKGNSHKDGGINLEVGDGYVKRIAGNEEADEIAKNGSFWKSLGATAYGVGEGLLDTITMGATDQLTDLGYNALQKLGGSTESQMREQNSLRGYGTTAGAITGGILSGGATTGAAIQQGAKGVGAGVSAGSPESKAAQAIGTYLPLAGNIAGMAVGNTGYGKGIDAATKGAEEATKAAKAATSAGDMAKAAEETAKAAKFTSTASKLSKFNSIASTAGKADRFAPLIQAASQMIAPQVSSPQVGDFQQAVRQVTPYTTPSMISTFGQYKNALSQEKAEEKGVVDGYTRGSDDTSIFWNQPTLQQNAMDYLSKYGING